MITLLLKYFLIFLSTAHASLESTSTLPKGVRSPEFSFGMVSGLGEKYNSNGEIVNVTDAYHFNLVGNQISKFYPPAKELIDGLNFIEKGLGDSLSLGTIDFKSVPTIDYYVVNPAYGLKENVAIGFAFPVIHFKNEMQILVGGKNNIETAQIDAAGFSQLQDGLALAAEKASNLASTVQNYIASKGFKPISNVEYTTIGDTQVYARYRYFENEHWKFAIRPYLLLPTGKSDDPDDLADYAVGGYTAVGSYFVNEYYLRYNLITTLTAQYQAHLPDKATVRVPSSTDFLPGIERKENVNRQAGNILDVTLSQRYQVLRWLGLGAFYDFTTKDTDLYSGSRGYDYGLLSTDTGYQTHKVGAFIELSSTDYYFEKRFSFPFILGYSFTNTVFAVNSPNILSHVLSLRMFF